MPVPTSYPNTTTAVEAFLASELRRDSNNFSVRSTSFLRSVASQGYSPTRAQQAAVRRIMVERGWRFTEAGIFPPVDGVGIFPPVDGVELAEATAAPPLEVNATCNDAPHIPNGRFDVQAGEESYQFRIFTIVRTSTDGLRNKRVVSWLDEDDGEWNTFAYLTVGGRLKVWRRFQERSTEGWQLAARQMLHMLRSQTGGVADTISEVDAVGVRWTLRVTSFACRYCSGGLTDGQRIRGHDGCSNWRHNQPEPVAPLRVRHLGIPHVESAPAPPPRRQRPAANSREVFTPSQVGGTWEQ